MSIEMENPQTLPEILDAAWNHVGQIRVALMCGNIERVQASLSEMDRLFSLAQDQDQMEEEAE